MPSFAFSFHTAAKIQSVEPFSFIQYSLSIVHINSPHLTLNRNSRLLSCLFISLLFFFYQLMINIFYPLPLPPSCSEMSNQAQQHHTVLITCSISKCSTRKGPKEERLVGEVGGPGLSYCSIPGLQDDVEPVVREGGREVWGG